jgi:glycogen debranching enzyme
MSKFERWLNSCREVLQANQLSSQGYRYTRPAPHVYEQQWLWDSCFHAMVYRWFDVDYAKDELLSLVAKQVQTGADAGMIPHMNYWAGGAKELWGIDDRSIITQPPLIATAALRVHQQAQDLAWLEKLYPALVVYQQWFDRRRDPDNDHLVSLIHAWEAGSDFSPRWDAPMGLNDPSLEESRAARKAYVGHLIAFECDVLALSQAGYFAVEALDFNAIRAAELEALAGIAQLLGKTEAQQWQEKARNVQAAIQARMILPDGMFDLAGEAEVPIVQESVAPFILLFGGCVSEELAGRLVETLQSERFWTKYPVPNIPVNHPQFAPNVYWRGNVWMSVNWLIYTGLRRYGYHADASALLERSLALVEEHGFHEYFNPLDGTGLGPAQQSWTSLVLDMLASEEQC